MGSRDRGIEAGKRLDRFDLYELCVQSPEYDARMLRAIHGGAAKVLGEDFCGSAGLSRAWATVHCAAGARAVAVDRDPTTVARARAAVEAAGLQKRVRVVEADVRRVKMARVDVICAQNYSICEIHRRADLVAYLRHARARLRPRGAYACDIYTGADAYFTGTIKHKVPGPGGERITHHWEQRTANPLSAMVVNALHFDVRPAAGMRGRAVLMHDAFVYTWRLWTIPELDDAMREAGFKRVQVYPRFAEAIGDDGKFHALPVEDHHELSDSFSAYVVGRL